MKLSIGFTGDIAFSEYMKDFYKDKSNIDKQIYNFLNNNDYNVLNFESPITLSKVTAKEYLAHKSDPKSLKFIKENIKNPILSLANNHMMDFGRKGLSDTLEHIAKEDLSFIGAGKNSEEAVKYVIFGDEVKVGVLALQYKDYKVAGSNLIGTSHEKHKRLIKKKIKELKKEVNFIVLVYHGGEEFINTPMPYTRRKLKRMLSWGADIIVCHHSHTVQGYEKIGNKMIFYSLGNFIFDTEFQRAQEDTDKGMLLRLIFTKNSYTYDTLFIANDRENDKLVSKGKNNDFRNIKISYRKNFKREARRFDDIRKRQKKLKNYRSKYSVSDLIFEKNDLQKLVSFQELVKKNYIKELDNKLVIKERNKIVVVFDRLLYLLRNINYKKRFYGYYSKIFR